MLDQLTVSTLTALVVVVAGVLYVSETLLRRDGLAGRLWAAAFLSGILTVLCYLVWAVAADAHVAVAIGNAAFVASSGFMWLGCRAYNEMPLRVANLLVGAGVAAAFASVLLSGPDGGDWAGAVPMFAAITVFAGAGAIATRRRRFARRWNALWLTAVLGFQSLFFGVRIAVFLTLGPDSDLFRDWLDSRATSLVTVTLTVVAAVVTAVLRAGDSNVHGQRDTFMLRFGDDGVLLNSSFEVWTSRMLASAEAKGETLCLIAIRVDELPKVAAAFGPGEREAIADAWRAGVRRYAPTAATVGEYDGDCLSIAFVTNSFADVRRTAGIIHRRLLDDFGALDISVVPPVGVGIALTDHLGYDFARLAAAADTAARRSVTSEDTTVVVAEA